VRMHAVLCMFEGSRWGRSQECLRMRFEREGKNLPVIEQAWESVRTPPCPPALQPPRLFFVTYVEMEMRMW